MPNRIALDLEWAHTETPQRFRCGSIFSGKGKPVIYTDLAALTKALAKLKPDTIICGHYVCSDLMMLVRWGASWCLPARFTLDDSLLASRLLFPSAVHDLKTVAAELGMRYESLATQPMAGETESDEFLEYCCRDAFASYHIAPLLRDGIDSARQNVLWLNNQFEKAFLAVEIAGLKFDIQEAADQEARIAASLSELVAHLPTGVSPSAVTNDNETRDWLTATYSEKELKMFPRTAKNEISVSVDYLATLQRRPPGFTELLKARELQSFLSLYIVGKRALLDEHQFLYPSYKLLVAKTHRRSTVPAIQNWPTEARKLIVSRWVVGNIVWGDYRQLEARLYAWQCKSPQMMEDLLERGYVGIASRVYGMDIEKGSEEYKLMKATILGSQYNMGAGKLRLKIQLDHGILLSYNEAQAKLDKLFNTYPEMVTERQRRIAYAWKTGTTWSDVGAPVPLYLLPDSYYPPSTVMYDGSERLSWERKQVDNFSINYPTQQLAGYVTGCALTSMQNALAQEHGGWNVYLGDIMDSIRYDSGLTHIPIAEVHDEIVMDSRDVCATQEFLRYHMTVGLMHTLRTVCPNFSCPLDVDIDHKPHWWKT